MIYYSNDAGTLGFDNNNKPPKGYKVISEDEYNEKNNSIREATNVKDRERVAETRKQRRINTLSKLMKSGFSAEQAEIIVQQMPNE